MNNIEILEKAIKVLTGNDTGIKLDFENTAQAIENLIKENKSLKEKAYKKEYYEEVADVLYKDSIPKSKVETEIKYLCQKYNIEEDYFKVEQVVDILNELLEEENNMEEDIKVLENMRDIKFRAYIKDNIRVPNEKYKMVEVKSLHLGSRKAMIGYSKSKTNYGNYSISFDDIELMQFTGLYDKNGKEIFEGDIVRFEDIGEDGYEYKEGFDFKNEAQVIYEDGQVTLTNFGEGDNSYYANDGQPDILDEILRNGNCEVIGNIYDNPELLEKGEQS